MASIAYHFKLGLTIRFLVLLYGVLHDKYFNVPFTDVDYEVFTDGARFVTKGHSPYEQQEYRYSPIIAYMLLPNIYLHPIFGKVLFSIVDALLGILIYRIVMHIYSLDTKAIQCSLIWLYNIFPIIIATRGNSDSLTALLILLVLHFHMRQKYIISGLLLGLCTHLRLYPVIFFMPLLVTTGDNQFKGFLHWVFSPIKSKLSFMLGFITSYASLTYLFYYLYGETFLQQTIIYHVDRTDIRHNFSVYFYFLYLDYNSFVNLIRKKIALVAPQIIIIFFICAKFTQLKHLPFSMFCTAFTFVIFNKVVTSQYIIWYLSLLPIFLPSISMYRKKVIVLIAIWMLSQAVWLISAYTLEFKGFNSFIAIWSSSIFILFVNIYILNTFVERYSDINRIVEKEE